MYEVKQLEDTSRKKIWHFLNFHKKFGICSHATTPGYIYTVNVT
jgi:hypothetical protein